ncbi:methyl-accepting chemotaxis sensory transducer [Paenibacillus vortex V453]|uniref:Methyl-accepting chemotaxis sensory transducer n=1 Tax=Paenibacillus vortex V453 TaxID=715225 RepID=A0A2R9SZ61_9BACL|nr:methyl-accepting chemotaxis protein [Paenibacillus vortex]EFU42596.1 methyl-accepting chemotaxis sensory transducer [Paenibacillus vortex V453]
MNMARRFQFRAVGMKLFVIFFATIVLLSSALGLLSYFISKDTVMDQVSEATSGQMMQAADKLDFLLSQYEATSRQWALDTVLREDLVTVSSSDIGIREKTEAENRIREKLNGTASSDGRMQGMRLVAPSLSAQGSYNSTGLLGLSSADSIKSKIDQIIQADGEPVWFPTETKGFMENEKSPTMTMGRLLKNLKNPNAQYILLMDIKDQAVGEVLANLKIGHNGQMRIVAADNRIVHDMDPAQLMQPSTITVPEGAAEGGTYYTANEQMVVYTPLKTAPWYMVGFAPVSDFVKATDKLLTVTLVVIAAAILVAVLIGYYMMRTIGRPLNQMCSLMEEGEQGNLRVRTDFQRVDEIGRLGHSFNQMMEQISALVDQTNASAKEVLATAEELAEASRGTSLTAGEIAAAMEQIAQGSGSLAMEAERENQLAENIGVQMSKVSDSNQVIEAAADRVLRVTGEGALHMDSLVEKSTRINQVNRAIVQNAEKLKDNTSSIHRILELMSEITHQTNVLSINATIEAARAGAAGSGFMVVANEVRSLADRSKESIQTVGAMILDIRTEVQGSVDALTSASPLFDEQLHSVQEAQGVFDNVRHEMDTLLTEISESTHAIEGLIESQLTLTDSISEASSIVQETSAATEEVASMSSEQFKVSEKLVVLSSRLEELSESLRQSLVKFRT